MDTLPEHEQDPANEQVCQEQQWRYMNINMLERREWIFKNFSNKSYLFADGGGGRCCSCWRGGGGDQSE